MILWADSEFTPWPDPKTATTEEKRRMVTLRRLSRLLPMVLLPAATSPALVVPDATTDSGQYKVVCSPGKPPRISLDLYMGYDYLDEDMRCKVISRGTYLRALPVLGVGATMSPDAFIKENNEDEAD